MSVRCIDLPFYALSLLITFSVSFAYASQTGRFSSTSTELPPSNSSPHDNYGITISVSGNTAVIGAPFDNTKGFNSGSVYVHTRNGGVWVLQQKLTASDSAPGDQFGWSVTLEGNTALIGARLDDDHGFNSGSVYVYTIKDGVWTEQQKLTAQDGSMNDQYGVNVSLSADTAVIGVPFDDDNGYNYGSAYIYTLNDDIWSLQQKLTASDGVSGDQFGWSVALQNDTLLIGSRFDDEKYFNAGAAYFYSRNNGTWALTQKLIATDGEINDQFGWSVALDDNTALIGSRFDDDMGVNSGSAYVFKYDDISWNLQQKLTASDGAPGDQYSWSIDLQGEAIIIGSPYDDNKPPLSGASYLYTRHAGVWSEQQKLTPSNEVRGDRYGISVALGENTMVVGACLDYGESSPSNSIYTNAACIPLWHEIVSLTTFD